MIGASWPCHTADFAFQLCTLGIYDPSIVGIAIREAAKSGGGTFAAPNPDRGRKPEKVHQDFGRVRAAVSAFQICDLRIAFASLGCHNLEAFPVLGESLEVEATTRSLKTSEHRPSQIHVKRVAGLYTFRGGK
jgi:hypothetical protein